MSLLTLNPQADLISQQALQINAAAAQGLMNVLKTNLGPNGSLKMLVSGAGDVKLTKDGCVLLHQMQIQHPTASLIARTATAQDDISGDGTTSCVLFVGELLRQCLRNVVEGLHPHILIEGIEIARTQTLKFLESYRTKLSQEQIQSREFLSNIAKTSLRTKLHEELADFFSPIVVDAVTSIHKKNLEKPIDLFMIETMIMEHQTVFDSRLVKGLVLDHGTRHPAMPKRSENCFILTCNISLEYEKTEVNSGFFYSNAEQREAMVKSERLHVDTKLKAIVDLKNKVCKENESFVVINQKGIDPLSLDYLHKNKIVAIRRAKRRNMERLTLACGGYAVNAIQGLVPECLGHADLVYEHVLGEDKFTFVEGVPNPFSCTILIKGPNKHSIAQIKEALKDGERAVKNAIEEKSVVRGAGAFEAACYHHLLDYARTQMKGRAKLGLQAFAEAMLIIPKTLVENSGLDVQEAIINLLEASKEDGGQNVGLDLSNGDLLVPEDYGIWDNYRAKRQIFHLGATLTSNILIVDEIIRAGKATTGGGPNHGPGPMA